MTTTASKNLQNKYYIWKKSDLSNMERKIYVTWAAPKSFILFIKDELETKPEDCVDTKNFFCFLFLSLIPEGSSFFKTSSPSWYKPQIYQWFALQPSGF